MERTADIIFEEGEGLFHGFADFDVGGKVDNGFGLFVLKGGKNLRFVAKIALNEMGARIDRWAVAAFEVVEYDDIVTRVAEELGGDASNVSGSAGNEYFHAFFLLMGDDVRSGRGDGDLGRRLKSFLTTGL